MPTAPVPVTEAARLAALQSYQVLDSTCEAAFDDLTRLAAVLTDSPIALVSLVDADRQWFKARHGLDASETPRSQAFCAHAILAPDQQLVVSNAPDDVRFADNPLVTGDLGIRAYAGTPLVNPEGHALGTLCVIDTVPRQFTAEQLDILQSLARSVQTTLELRRALLQVREMAMTDALTGIANRPAFLSALESAVARHRRHGGGFGMLYLDLDGFKRTNDLHGHAAGDAVLRAVADVLARGVRREEKAARIGGDEFAVLLVCEEASDVSLAAERIRLAINTRMEADGWPVTASVGAVTFLSPPSDAAHALNVADQLMYEAKGAGKNRAVCRTFDARAPNLTAVA
ncbi:GGDEF domain-containing protein [Roseicella aquatilis]|uniref:Sensor domain-containing diguanylate cyclase n=1 Tax=Roseicella aquatilis TaxID=2527868 RepID=A0A4V2WLV3_9PROT|nr:sensor domain-containing diguanylate cyclase [Roseicella aquatilis]TCZ64845.1 sensor domain-containing diguanylate cyclase [Roseicella aquatilis]